MPHILILRLSFEEIKYVEDANATGAGGIESPTGELVGHANCHNCLPLIVMDSCYSLSYLSHLLDPLI